MDLPWYPILFAAAWVLNLWVETGVGVLAMTRSLAIVVVGCGLNPRDRDAPSAVARFVAGVMTITGFGLLVSRNALPCRSPSPFLTVTIPLAVWYWARIRHRPFSLQRITRALNGSAL